MTEPTGYTALDLIGFTDQGEYDATTAYVHNDLVHYNNSIWRCLVDDTTGQTPAEGTYWTIFIDGSYLEDKVDWDDYAMNGAVNMAPNDMVTQTASDATFTVNSDKTITQTGNVTAQTSILLGTTTLHKGTYTVSDGIHDIHLVDSTQKYVVYVAIGTTWIARSDGRDTLNQTFTLNEDTVVNIWLRIYSGYGNNNTYKPMIAVASYTGDYVPYAKTNYELTTDKAETSIISDEYDSTATYAVGDYFIYDNVLYYVDVACTGITPPNTNYYTATSVSSEISNLKSNLIVTTTSSTTVTVGTTDTPWAIAASKSGYTPLLYSMWNNYSSTIIYNVEAVSLTNGELYVNGYAYSRSESLSVTFYMIILWIKNS